MFFSVGAVADGDACGGEADATADSNKNEDAVSIIMIL